MRYHTLILAQQPAAIPPAPSGNVLDWGIAIAVLVFLAKEAIGLFHKKEEAESALTNTLIQDLRQGRSEQIASQQAMTERLATVQERTTTTLEKLNRSVEELNSAAQQDKRDNAVIIAELRDLRDKVVVVNRQLEAVHERLDKLQVPAGCQIQ